MALPDQAAFDTRVRVAVMAYIVEAGFAPTVEALAARLDRPEEDVRAAFHRLHESHGLVLHPNSDAIWVAHPFSLAPTSFWVTSERGSWWGNCGWCALGIAAVLQEDTRIVTRLAAQDEPLELHVRDGVAAPKEVVLHIALPVAQWWDNVHYTCGTILFFQSDEAVDAWCRSRNIPRGQTLTLDQAWHLARSWYHDYLSPDWHRRSADEAQTIFEDVGLTGPFWALSPDWK